jgi:hypothetical protein
MEMGNIIGLFKHMADLERQRALFAFTIVQMIKAEVPESPASLSIKIAALASFMDTVDSMDDSDELKGILKEAIEQCFTFLGNVPEIAGMDLRKDIAEMREAKTEQLARQKAGDDILKGIDLNDLNLN